MREEPEEALFPGIILSSIWSRVIAAHDKKNLFQELYFNPKKKMLKSYSSEINLRCVGFFFQSPENISNA